MKRKPLAISIVLAVFLLLFLSARVSAGSPIARFVFITEPQTITIGGISGEIKIQAQDINGSSISVGKTLCLGLSSTSGTGEFSSNSDSWNPINVLTINSNWTSRAFYYKDSGIGNHRIDASVAVKPDGTTCSLWPVADWNVQWSASQNITIGTGETSSAVALPASSSVASLTPGGTSSFYHAPVAPLSPVPTIQAFVGDDRIVAVGVEENFIGEAMGLVREPITHARFWWNFGDGQTAEGKAVGHVFRALGTYIVGLHVSSGDYAASDYMTVSVVPNQIAIASVIAGGKGYIQLENGAGILVDIGGWILEDDYMKRFYIPVRTVVGAHAVSAFANQITGLTPEKRVALRSPDESVVVSWSGLSVSGDMRPRGEYDSASPAKSQPISLRTAEVSSPEPAHLTEKPEDGTASSVAPHAEAAAAGAFKIKGSAFSSSAALFGAALVLSMGAAIGFFCLRRMIS